MQPKVSDKAEERYAAGTDTAWYSRMRTAVCGQLLVWATRWAGRCVRLRLHGLEHVHAGLQQGRPIIFAGWHGHNSMTMYAYYAHIRKLANGTIIVPKSRNGDIMNYLGRRIHLDVIQVKAELGPSQWARATISLIKAIRGGRCALLSPDGPDGPACRVKPGIAVIGQQTQAIIIPASAAATRTITLRKRWDQHLIPLPFSRAVVLFGPPIDTQSRNGEHPSQEQLQTQIEEALQAGAMQADQLCRQRGKPPRHEP